MKKTFFIILLIIVFSTIKSQNYIPNPSFENTSNVVCGIYSSTDFESSVNYWTTAGGTPDLFSTIINQSCWNFQPNSTYPGPICLKGYQLPRTGNVMAGMFCYTIPNLNQREYIQTQLTSPLTVGNYYCLQFYLSLANNTEKYTDKIGAYFSVSPVSSGSDQPLLLTPQVVSSNFISDTLNWILVSGTFQAISAFNYITIGNFNNDASTVTGLNPGGGIGPGCYGVYYFVDDVSITDCATGVEEVSSNDYICIYPNPVINNLIITSNNNDLSEIIIYDIFSREIIIKTFSGMLSLNTENISKGLYLYQIKINNKICKKGKLVFE